MCDCIEKFNEAMADHNTILNIGWLISISTGETLPNRVIISTTKRDKKVRKGPCNAIPTYCPFCGVKYEQEQAVDTNT